MAGLKKCQLNTDRVIQPSDLLAGSMQPSASLALTSLPERRLSLPRQSPQRMAFVTIRAGGPLNNFIEQVFAIVRKY